MKIGTGPVRTGPSGRGLAVGTPLARVWRRWRPVSGAAQAVVLVLLGAVVLGVVLALLPLAPIPLAVWWYVEHGYPSWRAAIFAGAVAALATLTLASLVWS